LKIPKGKSLSVNHRRKTYNTMAKRKKTNNDTMSTKQYTEN